MCEKAETLNEKKNELKIAVFCMAFRRKFWISNAFLKIISKEMGFTSKLLGLNEITMEVSKDRKKGNKD